jgi:hypothetical protein
MINTYSKDIINNIDLLISLIDLDITELKTGNSDNMIERNNQKQKLVNDIKYTKTEIDTYIIQQIQQGNNVEQYRSIIDTIESKLQILNKTNSKLAYIILPLKDMYDGIINDFFKDNQSSISYSA